MLGWIILGIFGLYMIILVISMCRAAARADRLREEIQRRLLEEEENKVV